MTHKSNRFFQLEMLVTAFVIALATTVWAQGTAFTYQSRLNDNGALANGMYDLQFSLFDADNGGAQIAATLDKPNIAVANGVFIVQLDFGANAFNGGQRFLQIAVRQAGTSGPFTTLSPRTEITSTPYAIRSLSAATADNATQLNGTNASQYVQTNDARLSDARDPKPGNANYIQNSTIAQAGSFNVTGNGTAGGTLSAGAINAASQFNLGGKHILSSPGIHNVFLGFDAGRNMTTGFRNTFIGQEAGVVSTSAANTFIGAFAGSKTTNGSSNVMVGEFAGADNVGGGGNIAIGAGSRVGTSNFNATAIGLAAFADCSSCFILGRSDEFAPKVGIGINKPEERLHVAGGNIRWGNSLLTPDQGGSIELGRYTPGTSTPYIDFNRTGGQKDYDVRLINYQTGKLQLIGQLDVTGQVCASNLICFSDGRLKEQVKTLRYGLPDLLALRPVSWQWKDRANTQLAMGMIAQDVEKVMPELILRNPNPDGPLGLNYVGFVPVIIKAVQEQQTLLEQKDAALKALQQENAALTARLANVEQALQQMQALQASPKPDLK